MNTFAYTFQNTYTFQDQALKKRLGDVPRCGEIKLTVDWEKLVRVLGTKAAFNKSRKSALNLGIKAQFVPKRVL